MPKFRSSILPFTLLLAVGAVAPLSAQNNISVPANSSLVLNESGSYQNVTVGVGGTLQAIDANSGGAGDHAISITLAAGGPGTIQNSGLIDIAGNDQGDTLVLANPVTLSGSGTMQLRIAYRFQDVYVQGPGTLTQAADHTLQGGGNDGGVPIVNAPLVNAGLVKTFGRVGLQLNGSMVNTGTFSVTNGATLTLGATTLDNTGGLVTVADATSFVNLAGTTVTGGTLSSANSTGSDTGGGIFHDSAPATLQNVTLAAGSVFNVENPLTIAGTLTNNGYFFLAGFNYNTGLTGGFTVAADATLAGTGIVRLAAGEIDATNNATLTVAAGASIYGGSGTINASLINNGTVEDFYEALTINSPTLTNNGLLAAANGSTLYLNGPALNNTNGTISVADTKSHIYLDGGTVTGGTLSSVNDTGSDFDSGGFFNNSSPATLANVTLSTGSAFYVSNPITIVGTLTNNGYFFLAGFNFNTGLTGGFTIAANATLAGTGSVRLAAGEIDATNNATLTVAAGASIYGGSGTINASLINNGLVESVYQTLTINSPTFTNNGQLIATNGGTVSMSNATNLTNFDSTSQTLTGGTYTVTDTGNGGTLDFGGRTVLVNAATVTLSGANPNFSAINGLTTNAGTLSLLNLKQFSTSTALTNTGAISLGAGTTFHTGGSFAGGAGSVLGVTVGGTQSSGAQSAGVLQVNGAATLGGTLVVTLGAGTQIAATDTVTIMAATGAVSGNFANVPNGERVTTADGTGSFQVNYGAASAFAASSVVLSDFAATGVVTHPSFFTDEVALSNGVYYLSFSNGNYFGYYSFLSDPRYIYHFNLGYEYVFDAADGKDGVYLYDFKSSTFFYTSPVFPFPYLYDFSLNSVLYYYPDPNNPGRYNTNGVRYFYDFATGKIITK